MRERPTPDSVVVDDAIDPFDKVGNLGIDAKLALLAASFAETGHSKHGPASVVFAEQGST